MSLDLHHEQLLELNGLHVQPEATALQLTCVLAATPHLTADSCCVVMDAQAVMQSWDGPVLQLTVCTFMQTWQLPASKGRCGPDPLRCSCDQQRQWTFAQCVPWPLRYLAQHKQPSELLLADGPAPHVASEAVDQWAQWPVRCSAGVYAAQASAQTRPLMAELKLALLAQDDEVVASEAASCGRWGHGI